MAFWPQPQNQQQYVVAHKPPCDNCGDTRYNMRSPCLEQSCHVVGCDFCMVTSPIGTIFCPRCIKRRQTLNFVMSTIVIGLFIIALLVFN